MDKDDAAAARLKAQTDYFNKCKELNRSVGDHGVCEVKVSRRLPENLEVDLNPEEEDEEGEEGYEEGEEEGEDQVMEDAEPEGLEVDLNPQEENSAGEENSAEDRVMEDAETCVDEVMQVVEASETSEVNNAAESEVEVSIDLPKLYQGSYIMEPTVLKCLIYKVHSIDPTLFTMCSHLQTVRHPAVVRLYTFYEDARELRIVLSWVDFLLRDLVEADKCVKGSTRFFNSRSLGTDFQIMILDVCSGLEYILKLDLYPLKISINDLYVCKDGPKYYRVQLLMLKVEKLTTKKEKKNRKTELWTQVRNIIEAVRKIAGKDELNEVDKRFINYIGSNVSKLAQYPLSWSYDQKGRYLMSIISVDTSTICAKLEKCALKWPKEEKQGKKKTKALVFPKILQLLIHHDMTRDKPSNYSTEEPYDYLRLSRTVYKHFPELCKEVPALKGMFRTREDFLIRMEKWEPMIWCILYEAIGPIESLQSSTTDKNNGSP